MYPRAEGDLAPAGSSDQVAIAVAEAHGGSVRTWSALGRGSVFEILPLLPPAPAGAAGK